MNIHIPNKILPISILSVLLLLSCSSNYIINQNDSKNNIKVINFLGDKYKTQITLNDSSKFFANYIEIKNDSLFTVGTKSRTISLGNISTIKLKDTGDGFADGIFLGIPISIVSTIAIINLTSNPFSAIIFPISFIGTIITTMTQGHNKTFEFK